MAIPSLHSLLFIFFFLFHPSFIICDSKALYFSKSTFFLDYQKMLTNLKIFIYPPPPQTQKFEKINSTYSIFYDSLLSSDFITHNPNQATVFFIPFPPLPRRFLAGHIEYLRASYPYWNPSLGADHFYFSCNEVGPSFNREIVELKKNSIRISCFPSSAREFIPHKDITFSPLLSLPRASLEGVSTRFLGYWRFNKVHSHIKLINALRDDFDFLIESKPSNEGEYLESVKGSYFCLFIYNGSNGEGLMKGLTIALAHSCVPVVITDRPIQDLPLMDLIKWSEIALFIGSNMSVDEFKSALTDTRENGAYRKMKRLGVEAVHHFLWNESSPQPYDAFHMLMYQLWIRRHAIKYATWKL
ncbi:unnamed protein product [Amaranthus hypochondriacus]